MRKMSDYPNTNTETESNQFGTFKNESEPNKSDGTDIKAEHMQDPYYALYQILQLAGEIPNGELENGNNSKQFIRSLTNISWFKYDSSIEYNKSSVVIQTANHITKLYRSQKEKNKDVLTNTASWINILTIGADNTITLNSTSTDNTSVFIGAFMHGIRNDTPEGWLRCDGNDYPISVFEGFINNYILTGKIPSKSLEDWDIEFNTNNGNVGYFGYQEEILDYDNPEIVLDAEGNPVLDTDNNNEPLTKPSVIQPSILRTPCLQDRVFIAQAINSGNIGKFIKAGLPDIIGNTYGADWQNPTGAFVNAGRTGTGAGLATGINNPINVSFAASRYNSIYGKTTNEVLPNHIQFPLFICVSNQAVPVSEAQYNGFIEGLNDRIKRDGSNAKLNNLSTEATGKIQKLNTSRYDNYINIAIGTTYTLDEPAIVYCEFMTLVVGTQYITINGVTYTINISTTGNTSRNSAHFHIGAGSTFYFSQSGGGFTVARIIKLDSEN